MVPGSTEGQEDASCHALLTEGCQGEGLVVGAVRGVGARKRVFVAALATVTAEGA